MQKRRLGKTGEDVSILGFGAMRLPVTDPGNPESIDRPLAARMMRTAFDAGVNYVDTGYTYHSGGAVQPGQSEPCVGEVLAEGYRGKVKVATKLPTWMVDSKKRMREILDDQLRRLGVEWIDFYLAHNLNHDTWPATRALGILEFLDEERQNGRIKHVGFSFHDHYSLFEELAGAFDWSFVQIQYNYFDTEYQAGRRGLELAAGKGMGVIVMEPLRGGLLTQHMPEDCARYLADKHPGWSLADWGLRWVWDNPDAGLALSGMSTPEQLEENLAIAGAAGPLTPEERDAAAEVARRLAARVKVNCTGCGYCLPCPSGVNIPNLFPMFNNYYLSDSDAHRKAISWAYNAYTPPEQKAGNCVSCGTCEPRCPQGIAIGKVMPEVAATFGG